MDYIKRILLIFILVLATFLGFEAKCAELSSTSNCLTISASKTFEKDFINSKENEFSLSAIQNVNTQITTRRNNDSNDNMPDDHIIVFAKKNNNLNIYTCNQSYLDDKNELALLLLLHQIQPNAP
jgi:hypothetical protein